MPLCIKADRLRHFTRLLRSYYLRIHRYVVVTYGKVPSRCHSPPRATAPPSPLLTSLMPSLFSTWPSAAASLRGGRATYKSAFTLHAHILHRSQWVVHPTLITLPCPTLCAGWSVSGLPPRTDDAVQRWSLSRVSRPRGHFHLPSVVLGSWPCPPQDEGAVVKGSDVRATSRGEAR